MAAFNLAPGETSISRIVMAIRQLIQGRSDSIGTMTLAANAGTTVVTGPNIGDSSAIFYTPQTANAAAEIKNGMIRIPAANVKRGQFTVIHANNAQTDRTFFWDARG